VAAQVRPLTLAVSYYCKLFVVAKNLNSFAIKHMQTLLSKYRGVRSDLRLAQGDTTFRSGFLQAPLAITFLDPDHSLVEQRFITMGMSSTGRVLLVAHADREGSVRIISARKTTQGERKHYEEKN
jgi:hypothetical protein